MAHECENIRRGLHLELHSSGNVIIGSNAITEFLENDISMTDRLSLPAMSKSADLDITGTTSENRASSSTCNSPSARVSA
jgi:hypothetical protein